MRKTASVAGAFDSRLFVDLRAFFRLAQATFSWGAILFALSLGTSGGDLLTQPTTDGEAPADGRMSKTGRHALVGLLRQSVRGRLAGWR